MVSGLGGGIPAAIGGITKMVILSETALTRLGDWIERTILKEECVIWRSTPNRALPVGETVDTPQIVATTRCAVLDRGAPGQAQLADQPGALTEKMVLLPRGSDVRSNDRLQVGTRGYRVIDTYEPNTYEVTRRALVERSTLP